MHEHPLHDNMLFKGNMKDGEEEMTRKEFMKHAEAEIDQTTLIIVTELFDDEDKPREVLACKKCGQAYKTRHDVINFCSNCGRKIVGERPLSRQL